MESKMGTYSRNHTQADLNVILRKSFLQHSATVEQESWSRDRHYAQQVVPEAVLVKTYADYSTYNLL